MSIKSPIVKTNLLDRALAWFSPSAGIARVKSRAAYLDMTSGYKGGKTSRRATRNWRPGQTSANEELEIELPELRARSRDLARNVPLAGGAIDTAVLNVIGDGLVLQSQIDHKLLGITPERAADWQMQAEREWELWCKRPDFTSRLNFDEMQALVFRAVLDSGDVFVVRRRRMDQVDVYGLKLQMIEADRCSTPFGQVAQPEIVDGVEMDADGVPVAYHFSEHYPDDYRMVSQREWRRIEAGSSLTGTPLVLHLYDQRRPGQARGIPYLAPVVEAIKQLGDYTDAEITAAVNAAMMFAVVETPSPVDEDGQPIIGEAVEGDDSVVELENGAYVTLNPGEKLTMPNPGRPNPQFEAFYNAFVAHLGVAIGQPYEVLTKRFTASYSASRAALEMAWQFFRSRRSWLAWKFCQPVYEWVITEAIVRGRLSAPGYFADPVVREAWLGSEWIGPSRIQLDPLKEANADKVDLENRVKTRSQIIRERTGGSWAQKVSQLSIEDADLRSNNLQSSAQVAPVQTTPDVGNTDEGTTNADA